MTGSRSLLVLVTVGIALAAAVPHGRTDNKSIEQAVLAVNAEMTKAGEAADADRLFSYMLDTDKGSVIQNGVFMATRQQALEQVKANLARVSKASYRWSRQHVTVLSPEVALLTAEGESTATTMAGDTFTVPLAQTIVFVLKDGRWQALHAHQSSKRQ